MRILLLTTALLCCTLLPAQSPYVAEWRSLDTRPTPAWWEDAKFGIFLHWGVYSVPAYAQKGRYAEWYQYHLMNDVDQGMTAGYHEANYKGRSYYDLANDFHAELYNPEEWASLFEKAGARYAVLTAKHHDGFCLWPSEHAGNTWGFPWSVDLIGPRKDLVGMFVNALQKTNVKPGLYFSLYEWFNPLWKFDRSRYAGSHAMPQLFDLVQRYEPWIVWSDGDWDAPADTWQSENFLAWLYNESTVRNKVVVNDRWGSGTRFQHGGVYTPEYQPDIDFDNHAWEESRGMAYSYGYNREEGPADYHSAQMLLLHLIDKVARGGNFLLDIGPDAHGQIPVVMQERLLAMGRWLTVNGEAIYGTRRWRQSHQWSAGKRNWKPAADAGLPAPDILMKQTIAPDSGFAVKEVFYTWKPDQNAVYAIFYKYPADRKLVLKGFNLPAGAELSLLGMPDKLKWENQADAVVFSDDRPGDDYRATKPKAPAESQQVRIFLPEFVPEKMKTPQAFVVKIKNFGAYLPKPRIETQYDPKTMQPLVRISAETPGAIIRFTTDGSEPKENSPEYKQAFTVKTSTVVKAKAFKSGLLEGASVVDTVRVLELQPALAFFREPAPGLKMRLMKVADGKYSAGAVQKGLIEKNEETAEPLLDPACQNGPCGMIWTGYIRIPSTGGWRFWTDSDDGSLLFLDNRLVVNNDGDHSQMEKSGLAYLQQGWHEFKVVYFNSGGTAALKLQFAAMGEAPKPIPAALFGH